MLKSPLAVLTFLLLGCLSIWVSTNFFAVEPSSSQASASQAGTPPSNEASESTKYFFVDVASILSNQDSTKEQKDQLREAVQAVAEDLPEGALVFDLSKENVESHEFFSSGNAPKNLTKKVREEYALLSPAND